MPNVTLDFGLALGSSQTGLSLKAQIVDNTDSPVGAAITTGFFEIGAGNYLWVGTIPQGQQGGVVFSTNPGGVVKAFVALNPADTQANLIGPGAIQTIFHVQDGNGNPVAGVQVWITTDAAGNNVIAGTLSTDVFGNVTFYLSAGTQYAWVNKPQYVASNPTTIVVS